MERNAIALRNAQTFVPLATSKKKSRRRRKFYPNLFFNSTPPILSPQIFPASFSQKNSEVTSHKPHVRISSKMLTALAHTIPSKPNGERQSQNGGDGTKTRCRENAWLFHQFPGIFGQRIDKKHFIFLTRHERTNLI